jgi:hypothetical protein
VANRVNEIVGRLRERGHGLTPQRYAVVRALVEGGEHPSAEQLFHRVSDAYPMMSRATVYKTLDTLKAAGEVLELEFRIGAKSLRREHAQRSPARGVHGLQPNRRRQAGSAGAVCAGDRRADGLPDQRLSPGLLRPLPNLRAWSARTSECLAVLAECSLTSSTARL